MAMASVVVMAAQVELDDGTLVARIEAVTIGGGSQVVTVDGVPEDRHHPVFHRFHVRLLSPDRMIPDELRETQTYEDAVAIAEKYAALRLAHAGRIADLAADLRV